MQNFAILINLPYIEMQVYVSDAWFRTHVYQILANVLLLIEANQDQGRESKEKSYHWEVKFLSCEQTWGILLQS